MSRDDRDQSGGHPKRRGRGLCSGCPYCLPITGKAVRRGKMAAITEGLNLLEVQEAHYNEIAHEIADGRCLRCDMSVAAIELTNAECDNERRVFYRTETLAANPS